MSKTFAISRSVARLVPSEQRIVATDGQSVFTFTGVPASYDDYIVFRNNSRIYSGMDYTTSGNDITTVPVDDGDIIAFSRK